MKKISLVLLFALFASFISIACSEKPRVRVPMVSLGSRATTIAGFHTEGCDESLWGHIYNPGRLEVVDKCISVTGTVARVKKEGDGDYSIQLLLDKGYEALLNEHNFDRQEGALIVRAICQTKDKEKKEECRNFDKLIEMPAKGAHVRVTGSYVLNRTTIYSWAEIYPATSITVTP